MGELRTKSALAEPAVLVHRRSHGQGRGLEPDTEGLFVPAPDERGDVVERQRRPEARKRRRRVAGEHLRRNESRRIDRLEQRGRESEVALDGENRLEQQRAARGNLERHDADRPAIHGDEVPPGIERRHPGRLQAREDAAHATVHHLLRGERQRLRRNERRAVRQRERDADEPVAERHGAPARVPAVQAHARLAAARRQHVIAAE